MRFIIGVLVLLTSVETAWAQLRPPVDHDEAAVLKQRVDEWLLEGVRRHEVEGGRVDPAYRQLESRLDRELEPPADVLKPHGYFGQLRDQLVQFEARTQYRQSESWRARPMDPSALGFPGGSTMRAEPLDEALEAEDQVQEPVWLELEVELHLDEAGHATGLRTVMPSGYGPFDRWALRKVARVMTRFVYPVPRAARVHYVVRGSYVAHMPLFPIAWFVPGHVEHGVELLSVLPDPD